MKKVMLFAAMVTVIASGYAFSNDNSLAYPTQDPNAPFRLFRTTNLWTFLMLDTADGCIWQLQFDVQGDNRGTVILNDQALIDSEKQFPGRFTLYPTLNMYTFILLDQFDGRTWQVQWAHDPELRGIMPIY